MFSVALKTSGISCEVFFFSISHRVTWTFKASCSVFVSSTFSRYNPDTNELINEELGIAYPIIDGIPNMIPQDARLIGKDEPLTPAQWHKGFPRFPCWLVASVLVEELSGCSPCRCWWVWSPSCRSLVCSTLQPWTRTSLRAAPAAAVCASTACCCQSPSLCTSSSTSGAGWGSSSSGTTRPSDLAACVFHGNVFLLDFFCSFLSLGWTQIKHFCIFTDFAQKFFQTKFK